MRQNSGNGFFFGEFQGENPAAKKRIVKQEKQAEIIKNTSK
jgi:hypothetical protein